MILLPLLLLVVLVALGAAGIGPLVFGNHDRRGSGLSLTPLVVIGIGAGAVVLLLVGPITVLGLRGGEHDAGPAPDRATATTLIAPAAGSPVPSAVSSEVLGPIVRVGRVAAAIGGLRSDTVLRLRVSGFEAFMAATARQCVAGSCGNEIPVQLDERGEASFQYLVVDDFAPVARAGRCRRDAPPCSIVVEHVEGDARVEFTTVFTDELPAPARVRVEPATGLAEGSILDVSVRGAPPGAALDVLICGVVGDGGDAACGAPATSVTVAVTADGSARASLELRGRPACADDRGCVVVVRSDDALLRAPRTAIGFLRPPGVDYDGRRLALGLGTALVLAAVATYFVRRTDWSAIGEEAAPEIDDAEYADLDAIVAAMPPEEDEELLV